MAARVERNNWPEVECAERHDKTRAKRATAELEEAEMEDGLEYKLWYGPERSFIIDELIQPPEIHNKAKKPPVNKGGERVVDIPEGLVVGAVVPLADGTECQITYVDANTGDWWCVPLGGQ